MFYYAKTSGNVFSSLKSQSNFNCQLATVKRLFNFVFAYRIITLLIKAHIFKYILLKGWRKLRDWIVLSVMIAIHIYVAVTSLTEMQRKIHLIIAALGYICTLFMQLLKTLWQPQETWAWFCKSGQLMLTQGWEMSMSIHMQWCPFLYGCQGGLCLDRVKDSKVTPPDSISLTRTPKCLHTFSTPPYPSWANNNALSIHAPLLVDIHQAILFSPQFVLLFCYLKLPFYVFWTWTDKVRMKESMLSLVCLLLPQPAMNP